MDLKKECVCAKLRKASRILTKTYDEFLVSSGLKVTQYSLMRNIQRIDQASAAKLSSVLLIDKTTLARNLKILAQKGLVDYQEGEDRRVKVIKLSREGLQALDNAASKWKEAQEIVAAKLGQERLDRLFEDLSVLEE